MEWIAEVREEGLAFWNSQAQQFRDTIPLPAQSAALRILLAIHLLDDEAS